MNERIYQLQGQAKVLAEQHIAHRKFDDVMEYRQVLYDTTMNKFAELIVRECLLCCERTISDPVPESVDTFEQGGIHCRDEIQQHFGVE